MSRRRRHDNAPLHPESAGGPRFLRRLLRLLSVRGEPGHVDPGGNYYYRPPVWVSDRRDARLSLEGRVMWFAILFALIGGGVALIIYLARG